MNWLVVRSRPGTSVTRWVVALRDHTPLGSKWPHKGELAHRQASADASTTKGLRDRAILAVLLGCGLRRSECATLTFEHVQQRDGRWCIVDLVGKHGRVRTIPMPA